MQATVLLPGIEIEGVLVVCFRIEPAVIVIHRRFNCSNCRREMEIIAFK